MAAVPRPTRCGTSAAERLAGRYTNRADVVVLALPRGGMPAAPVAAPSACAALRAESHEGVCLASPAVFFAIGEFYRSFPQTSDEEVRTLLEEAAQGRVQPAAAEQSLGSEGPGSAPPLP
jgi:predicted phosphoribosyltransferase